jgi:hypothetical protein
MTGGVLEPGQVPDAIPVLRKPLHDVAGAPCLMNVLLGPMLIAAGLGDGGVDNVRNAVDGVGANPAANPTLSAMVSQAPQQCFDGCAILMTSVGVPMFSGRRGIWRCPRPER